MKKFLIKNIFAFSLVLIIASCGSKKALVGGTSQPVAGAHSSQTSLEIKKLSFVQKVSDNKVYAKNIVGSMSFNIKAGDKDISCPGSVRMRKDEVIRLQLFIPLLGSEVGRLEFTPDYVLVIDRIHKEYIKADYSQLDFLKDNGLNFYSLQALFWNQLLLPGTKAVSESDLNKFDVNLDAVGTTLPVSFGKGNIKYVWNADKTNGHITTTDVTYASTAHGTSNLNWKYSNFKSVGAKVFPAKQIFSFTTTATRQKQTVSVTLDMKEVKTDSDWEAQTVVSNKYKKVEAQDVFGKLLNM